MDYEPDGHTPKPEQFLPYDVWRDMTELSFALMFSGNPEDKAALNRVAYHLNHHPAEARISAAQRFLLGKDSLDNAGIVQLAAILAERGTSR